MDRRDFFRHAAALGVAALGAVPAAAMPPGGPTLTRLGRDGRCAEVGWFEQRPGDLIVAAWPDGTAETWAVTGVPHWTDNQHGRVPCVVCEQVVPRRPLAGG